MWKLVERIAFFILIVATICLCAFLFLVMLKLPIS